MNWYQAIGIYNIKFKFIKCVGGLMGKYMQGLCPRWPAVAGAKLQLRISVRLPLVSK